MYITGRPLAKCDPLLYRPMQHEPPSSPMGDHFSISGNMINMQILC